MKKILGIELIMLSIIGLTGCEENVPQDDSGNEKKQFNISKTATINDTKIKINSIKKIEKECSWEYDGECQSYTEPDNDYFLVIDLTIENTGSEDLAVSSMMSFELKDSNGEKGKYAFLTEAISSQLDGTVMAGDLLKGQIAYDVKDSETFNFYYSDNLDDQIKFTFNQSDIK